MNTTENTDTMLTAIVSGGSLGGLMSAIVLRDLGYRVTVLERSRTMESQGAGIVCGGETSQFFARFDKTKTPLVVQSLKRQYLSRNGELKYTENSRQVMTSWDKLYWVLRSNFDGYVKPNFRFGPGLSSLASQANGTYLVGHRVQSHTYDAETKRVKVSYQNDEGKDETAEVDLLVCAEGPSSDSRKVYEPNVGVQYGGYVAFRGLVPEKDLSPETWDLFIQKFTFYHGPATQYLCYTIPGPNGSLEKGERHLNWVWYWNYEEDSPELERVMTDNKGVRHYRSLRAGELTQDIVEKDIRARAQETLPPQPLEVIMKTRNPFVQLITDALSPRAVFADGHVVLVGDSVCGPRPHTAASTSQAADHAMRMHAVMATAMARGDRTGLKDFGRRWEADSLAYGRQLAISGQAMGNRSQFSRHPVWGWVNLGLLCAILIFFFAWRS